MEHLITEHDLFPAYFNNLKYFKETAAEVSNLGDAKLSEGASYDEHIETRLEFLHYILANSNYQLM